MNEHMDLTAAQEDLLGALIGLMNAIPGNEHMANDDTDALMWRSLHLLDAASSDAAVRAAAADIRSEKFRIVPGCAACAHPCGRTSYFDMSLLHSEHVSTQKIKWDILRRLAMAEPAKNPAEAVRAALRAISEYWDPASLNGILERIMI